MDMREKVFDYMRQHHMTAQGDLVIAGVSGGADSVCLLVLLSELAERLDIELEAVHVNHMLREEAGEDEAYVKELCGRLEVPLTVCRRDVKAEAAAGRISCEEAGREARYAAFEEAGEKRNAQSGRKRPVRIAVAHHQDDRAETMLFHLFRGTGLAGMTGIRPVRERVIRPLLCISRREIERYLADKAIPYCTDATNGQDLYTRNKIRRHILPFAEREICSGSVKHMNRAADIFLETEQYLFQVTEEALARCLEPAQTDMAVLRCPALLQEKPLIQKRILLAVMEGLTPHRKDIGARHVESLLRLAGAPGCKSVSLPYGITAVKEYDMIVIKKPGARRTFADGACPIEAPVFCPEGFFQPVCAYPADVSPEEGKILEFEVFPYEKSEIIPQKPYTKWFDYDKIKKSVIIRTRRTGDYLTVDSGLSKKTLKAYMIDRKIPKGMRDHIPVLADGNHILWIIGYRISEYYKVNDHTKRILKVQLKEGSPSEERKEPGNG